MTTQSFVRITYTTPENELTAIQKAIRERIQAEINLAIERFHEAPGVQADGLVSIELYPCDCADEYGECAAA